MVSAVLMLRRLARAVRYAAREEEFLPVLSAGVALIAIGTISYALGEDWNVIDALYFSVATLTTTSVADPDLVLDKGWMKIFTVFYVLLGIGILVEIIRRLAFGFVAVRAAAKTGSATSRAADRATGDRPRRD